MRSQSFDRKQSPDVDSLESGGGQSMCAERGENRRGCRSASACLPAPFQALWQEPRLAIVPDWERRIGEGAQIRVIEPPLRPDPEMTDDYLIEPAWSDMASWM
jgi:hypothetical protein